MTNGEPASARHSIVQNLCAARLALSFPRSAWERASRRSASHPVRVRIPICLRIHVKHDSGAGVPPAPGSRDGGTTKRQRLLTDRALPESDFTVMIACYWGVRNAWT